MELSKHQYNINMEIFNLGDYGSDNYKQMKE